MRQHILPALGDRQIRQIKPLDVEAFIAGMQREGLSASRIHQAYHLLDATLKAAVKNNRLVRSPCIKIDLPKLTKRKEGHIGAAKLAALAKASGPFRPLILLLGYSGMRWGEAVALRVRSIDFLGGKITVSESMAEVGGTLHFGTTKTDRERTIRVPRAVLDLLEEQVTSKGPDDLVFTRSDGGPLRHANFRMRVWLPALRAARLPATMRIHDLRHTCAALLIEQGAHPKVIQVQLGHASITTTLDIYGHLFDDKLDELAEGMDKTFAEAERKRTRTKSGQSRRLEVVAGQQQLL